MKRKIRVVNTKFVFQYTSDNLLSNSMIVERGDRNKVINYNNFYKMSVNYQIYSYNTDAASDVAPAGYYVLTPYSLEASSEAEATTTVVSTSEDAI